MTMMIKKSFTSNRNCARRQVQGNVRCFSAIATGKRHMLLTFVANSVVLVPPIIKDSPSNTPLVSHNTQRDDALMQACASILAVVTDPGMQRIDVCAPRFGGISLAVPDAVAALLYAYDVIESEIVSDDARDMTHAMKQRAMSEIELVPCSFPIV